MRNSIGPGEWPASPARVVTVGRGLIRVGWGGFGMKAHIGFPLLIWALGTAAGFADTAGAATPAADPPGIAHVRDGDKLMQEGRFDDAQASYKRAIAANPKSHLAYEGLGRVFFARGLYATAVEQ